MGFPSRFGRYLLLERINSGGMAEVLRAKVFGVEGFERFVAIKRILPTFEADDDFINMFIDEARIAAQLSHPNIVQIYELGRHNNDLLYIAMEYVAGMDLRHVLADFRKAGETMPVQAAAYIASKMCEGLDFAHTKTDPSGKALNLVHRDVSPQNVLISFDGGVKVTDFGIAKAETRASRTEAGVLKGKFGYMSPEQVGGDPIDKRTDIFAVGIVLYQMLTNTHLFKGDSDLATLEKVRNAKFVPPSTFNPNLPHELEEVLRKALARKPEQRYQRATDLYDDLQRFLITENTIFDAKRLSALILTRYKDRYEEEKRRMEAFADVQAPSDDDEANEGSTEVIELATGTPLRPEKSGRIKLNNSWGDDAATGSMGSPRWEHITGAGSNPSGRSQQARVRQTGPQPVFVPEQMSHYGSNPVGLPPPPPQSNKELYIAIFFSLMIVTAVLGVVIAIKGNPFAPKTKGTIHVTTIPAEADFFLDNQAVGTGSPQTFSKVEAGPHTLVVKASGYEDLRKDVLLRAGSQVVLKLTLKRQQAPVVHDGKIQVSTVPSGAHVTYNGQNVEGMTPLLISEVNRHAPINITLSLEGYAPKTIAAQFAEGQTIALISEALTPLQALGQAGVKTTPPTDEDQVDRDKRARRRPERPRKKEETPPTPTAECAGKEGRLSVMATGASDCSVTVGGTIVGTAPMFKGESPSGKCPIVVTCPSGEKYKTTLEIGTGDTTKLIIRSEDWQ